MKENFRLQFYAWNCSAISVTATLLFDCFDTQPSMNHIGSWAEMIATWFFTYTTFPILDCFENDF